MKLSSYLKIVCFLVPGIFVVFFTACQSIIPSGSGAQGEKNVLRLTPGEDNPRNSEGDFIQLKDGRILFVYGHFTGGSGDNAQAHLAGRYSSDGGQTWSEEDVLIVPNEGGMNVMCVSFLRLQDGNIALFYLRKNSLTDCRPMMRISTDEAKTWSEPKVCVNEVGYYVLNNDRAVQLKNGRIILPLALHPATETTQSDVAHILCYFSDDNGKTWKKGSEAANKDNIMLQEPGLVELKDGRLFMFIRTYSGFQYLSFSEDKGETWSPVQPSNIKSPLSPASIERIPSTGDLLLVWNNNNKPHGKRTPYNIAISKDEGTTWEKIKNLESDPDGWYCYTAIEFLENSILLGHCAGNRKKNNGLATTQITHLTLDWLYQDPVADPLIKSDDQGKVILSCPTKGAEIRYTTDESMPTLSSALYTDFISVERTTQLFFRGFKKGQEPSALVTKTVGIDLFQQPQNPDQLVDGLFYEYFKGDFHSVTELIDSKHVKAGVLPQFSVQKAKDAVNFGYKFSGFIDVSTDGLYTFYLRSNDGSALYINDKKLINNDGLHHSFEEFNSTSLRAGKHKIAVDYFQNGGGRELVVSWEGPGFLKQEIPNRVLFNKNKK